MKYFERVVVLLLLLIVVLVADYNSNGETFHVMEDAHHHYQGVPPRGWVATKKHLDDIHPITLTFALKLRNMDRLESLLNDISNPDSDNYRKYLTKQQVDEMTLPDIIEVNKLRSWITDELMATIVKDHSGFIVVEAPIYQARKWLDTHFEHFVHQDTGKQVIRTLGRYHLPIELKELVQFVGGTTRFPNSKLSQHTKPDQHLYTYLNKLQQVGARKLRSPFPTNSPIISRLYQGDQSFAFIVLPVCKDGSTSTNANSICSGPSFNSINVVTPNNKAVNSTFTYTSSSSSSSNKLLCASCNVFPNSQVQTICQNTNQALNLSSSTVYCISPEISSPLLPNYLPLNISITNIYSDGSSSTPLTLTTYLSPFLTPQVIQQFYGMPMLEGAYPPPITPNSIKNRLSCAAFLEQYYNDNDLKLFLTTVGLDPRISQRVNIIGPNNQSMPGAEASLDIQWLLGLAPGYNFTFWSVAGLVAGQEPFLEWITDVLNAPEIVYTHSVSYADDEDSLSLDYVLRINDEFIKAGAVGMTILFGSGDDGCNSNSDPVTNRFYPTFPASSPYVLSVGGTMLSTQTTPVCQSKVSGVLSPGCNQVGEIVSSIKTGSRITSGGGFSNIFSRPSYQDNFTLDYLNNHLGYIPPGYFNASGRSYPDISGLSHNYLIVLNGELVPVDGTSASTPQTASIIAIINDRLLSDGQPPLGFINPTLYKLAEQYPYIFQDIVLGDNACKHVTPCNQYGYIAVPGYDAVTGIGRPNFKELDHHLRHIGN